MNLDKIMKRLNASEDQRLFKKAARSTSGVRRRVEKPLLSDYRQPFSLDVDRILHSKAYSRYIDKTQVFYLIQNDHITHRVLHVQLVSKIARTIGRFLSLNEDLIEAIALGHDIGHTPFGHDGERFLSKLCFGCGIGHFLHNVQSVQFLDKVERRGTGWNLCLQTLDGILCHDGEIHNQKLEPIIVKSFKTIKLDIDKKKKFPDTALTPMTLEGCVVRMADTISYIGRDFEDAIRLGIIQRSDMPSDIKSTLGDTNGTIVYRLVTDIITHSYQKEYIAFSAEISEALQALKKFNMHRIYLNPQIKDNLRSIEQLFEMLFERYLSDLCRENRSSVIFSSFLHDKSSQYIENHRREEIVRDFIAGMTDRFFLQQCPEALRPNIRSTTA
jgi:dGTPase